jgi:hypothetical protein
MDEDAFKVPKRIGMGLNAVSLPDVKDLLSAQCLSCMGSALPF